MAGTADRPADSSLREVGHDDEPGQGEESPDLFELYKFAVEMADRISARRGLANSFFLTVNTGLTAAIGLVSTATSPVAQGHNSRDQFGAIVVTLVGMLFAATWWVLLRSYRDLSKAKWEVIYRLEDRMDTRVFKDEWTILKAEQGTTWRRRYRELGWVERAIPLLFLGIYATFAIRICAT